VGFDTLIEMNGLTVGKPKDAEEAESILESLSGRKHRVVTGIALLSDPDRPLLQDHCSTDVYFKPMERDEIALYLATGEWRGVAGAYRIQERGAFFVDRIEGSYSNVVGLPLSHLYGILRSAGYPF
jgi:septum formation protein